jgi:hypothetical protein
LAVAVLAGVGALAGTGLTQSRTAGVVQQLAVTGSLEVVWGDPVEGQPRHRIFLVDDFARTYEVRLAAAQIRDLGGISRLSGQRVTVDGEFEPRPPGAPARPQVVNVYSLRLELAIAPRTSAAAAAAPVMGSQPWVNLLCRFADIPTTQHPVSYFEELLGGVKPGLDHYWREVSYDQINIVGSQVFGWYNLPQPRSYYIWDMDGDGEDEAALSALAKDCTAVADADVFFPDYIGINLMFNELLDCCAWGGGMTLDRDGQVIRYRTTWEPPRGYNNQAVLAHEMGHGFGLPHSSGPYGYTYDSEWDVMSGKGMCRVEDPEFGCVGIHTISYHKDRLAWIPADRIYEPVAGSTQTIALAPLDAMPTGAEYLMVRLPFGDVRYYTVEARRRVGYDWDIPGDAVVMHEVDEGRSRPAWVVDADANGDTNDYGARWETDESFIDFDKQIAVTVEPSDGLNETLVTIRYQTPIPDFSLAVAFAGDGAGGVTSEPAGIACGAEHGSDACSADFQLGTPVTLHAEPVHEGPLTSRFDGWSGDCEGTESSCAFWVTGEESITAAFTVLPPRISLSSMVVEFDAMRGFGDPPSRKVGINNTGGATLADLSLANIEYTQGGGWLETSFVAMDDVPVELALSPRIAGLASGTYSAIIELTSQTAVNSPQTVEVTLNLVDAPSTEHFAAALLGGPRLQRIAERLLDDLGNGNGWLDPGDFLAWLDATGSQASPALLDSLSQGGT